MRAAIYHRYGPPEVLQIEDVPKPVAKDNEVLVRVCAATVCAADWRLRKADPSVARLFNGLWRPRKLKVLGMEFSGTVESVGRAVTRFRPGDLVFGGTLFKFGTHAEYVCLPENGLLAVKPDNLALEDAAAFFFGGLTAINFLHRAPIKPGQRILVYGASGSVGVFAVQVAKHFGGHVTAVCSTDNLDWVKTLGADAVVDYTREDFSAAGPVYDVIFDAVGFSGYWRSMKSLKPGGAYLLVAGFGYKSLLANMVMCQLGGLWARLTRKVRLVGTPARGGEQTFALIRDLAASGKLRTVIEKRYPLAQIADAHRHAESGRKKGHVLILMRETQA